MTQLEIEQQIKFWESEADCAEEELREAEYKCREYYKMLDNLKENLK